MQESFVRQSVFILGSYRCVDFVGQYEAKMLNHAYIQILLFCETDDQY